MCDLQCLNVPNISTPLNLVTNTTLDVVERQTRIIADTVVNDQVLSSCTDDGCFDDVFVDRARD